MTIIERGKHVNMLTALIIGKFLTNIIMNVLQDILAKLSQMVNFSRKIHPIT